MEQATSEAQGDATSPGPDRAKQRRAILWVFLPPAILALTLIANGAMQARDRSTAQAVAEKALSKALAKMPFPARLPDHLPDGARMVRVFLDEPDSDQGFQAYQLNVWYRTEGDPDHGGGRTVHVWQSNDKFLARKLQDPTTLTGTSETINGETWHRVTDARVTEHVVSTYSRRYDDGITMTVDSKDRSLALAVILHLVKRPA